LNGAVRVKMLIFKLFDSMEITETFYARSRPAWRKWLEKNQKNFKELWLIFYKKHIGIPCISYNDAVEEALCFGWIDSTIKRIDDEKYARKFTPRNSGSKWSELNKDRARRMIDEKKMTSAGLQTLKDVDLNESLKVAKQNLSVPGYFMDALAANGEAYSYFNTLPPSSRRLYVLWIDSAKKEETRQKRLQECISLLSQGKKLPMK
jgi:uncharacterized protein YdeI (YjbR/CyaY-like superfamily)